MSHIEQSSISCGVYELFGLVDPRTSLRSIFDMFGHTLYKEEEDEDEFTVRASDLPAFILFSHNYSRGKDKLADLSKCVEENKLGLVHRSDWRKNNNSGEQIRVIVWTVNKSRLAKHLNSLFKDAGTSYLKEEEPPRYNWHAVQFGPISEEF